MPKLRRLFTQARFSIFCCLPTRESCRLIWCSRPLGVIEEPADTLNERHSHSTIRSVGRKPPLLFTTPHGIWSEDEHDRFLLAIKEYPRGPWGSIASAVGTRSVRQVQTHTQKYYEKIMRRVRGLRKDRKTWARVEHRIDDDVLTFCEFMKSMGSNKVMVSDPDALKINTKVVVSPPSSTNSSPCTSPVQSRLCIEDEPEEELDATEQPLATFASSTLDLPPLGEALDFLIKMMEQ
ncbi:hypothetical protein PC129_g5954 [Phytophthora cactorum]|uniref:Myb domain n=1 Tax=Phytophthora cactorum TaxID=29920 RepID=A0A8T1L6P8_9STRA|nr:hypothetical protein Pcac1_g24171 [Phytophthora cactorum]KAG2838222.1 hypothetical protein PC111_g4333 [Phytophthora cactorum]KAG2838600.1 hypothetical protein PC112_g4451 [Phytophthora cactorum]KAG2864704.1 hypothetical protein PC113_g4342 [Phytophthora cactorum]KAG2923379.1 hypothetical protein PC114_g4818 [Phytophthora cactorum]